MSHNLETGKKIVELYEKKIEAQNTLSIGFFGAAIFVFFSFVTRTGEAIDLCMDWVLWISYVFFGATLLIGYIARMSLIACTPSMMNYDWSDKDASKAEYGGKDVLENLMLFQLVSFLSGILATGVFFVVNFSRFVR